jgi:aryl-alcohol dehydrogenase-like predicted oxidoreductase
MICTSVALSLEHETHLDRRGLDVSRIGHGAMSMSGYYHIDAVSDAESIRTIHRALDLGVTHIDTAQIYGPYSNEELVGRAVKDRRDQVVLATKFGIVSHSGGGPGVIDSSPANVRAAVEGSLKRIGTDHIDLYYRVDPNTPIEDTAGALATLVAEATRTNESKRCARRSGRLPITITHSGESCPSSGSAELGTAHTTCAPPRA